jgi:hypothetical protein
MMCHASVEANTSLRRTRVVPDLSKDRGWALCRAQAFGWSPLIVDRWI